MSIATDVLRIKGNITAALGAIADKGVNVPDGSTSDALASLIASIEAGGGGTNIDWRGFPVLTGTFTLSTDITSDYIISFQEGERMHYRTIDGSGSQWKPMFLLFPDTQNVKSLKQGYIQNVGNFPNTDVQGSASNNTGTIFAYTDGTSVNTTYVKGVYGVKISQTGYSSGTASYQEVTITSVKIPATSSLKLQGGLIYRWMLYAGIYAEEVSIV